MLGSDRLTSAHQRQAFVISGTYRVQSRKGAVKSLLDAAWLPVIQGELDAAGVNMWLARHPLSAGSPEVTLRTAAVRQRSGGFSEGDAIYYRQFFTPAPGSAPMDSDVLDIAKLMDHWNRRLPYLRRIVNDETFDAASCNAKPTWTAARNEYYCHEAGHALGWRVQHKYAAGYFRLGERTRWPLVFIEELRADLQSFGAALDLLPIHQAAGVFAYHLAHRLGLAALSATTGEPGAGSVPYLFCAVLDRFGAIAIGHGTRPRLELRRTDVASVAETMRNCAEFAAHTLTEVELSGGDALDISLQAARCYRELEPDAERYARAVAAIIRTARQ